MGYTIELGAWRSVFAVPSEIVDRHLRLAGETQLKVILYLLRHSDEGLTIEKLAEAIGRSLGDTGDALEYWVGCGLVRLEGESILPAGNQTIAEAPPADDAADEPEYDNAAEERAEQTEKTPETAEPALASAESTEPKARIKKEKIRYSYSECMDFIRDDDSLVEMLRVLEGILCRQLNNTDTSVFVTLVKWYGMATGCVALLTEYCLSAGKPSIAYIEQTGAGWAGEDITSVEKATEKISELNARRLAWSRLRDIAGIPKRAPSRNEEECAVRWIDEWGFSPDMIKLAYDRCIDSKGHLVARYMNGIMQKWHDAGLTRPEQVAELDDGRKQKSAANDTGRYAPTYDKKEIETLLDDGWDDDE